MWSRIGEQLPEGQGGVLTRALPGRAYEGARIVEGALGEMPRLRDKTHAAEHGCVEVIVALAIDELGEQLPDGQGGGMTRALPGIAHEDLRRIACHLSGAMPRPPEAEVHVEDTETAGEPVAAGPVDTELGRSGAREGNVVDTHPQGRL